MPSLELKYANFLFFITNILIISLIQNDFLSKSAMKYLFRKNSNTCIIIHKNHARETIWKDFIWREYQKKYINDIASFREDFKKRKESMDGTGPLSRMEDTKEYINLCIKLESKENVPSHLVPATQFLFIRESDDCLVGMLQVRHYFNEFLIQYGGLIGYSIRPSERDHGYAKDMLRQALPFCSSLGLKRILIPCLDDNIASERTIIANGGIYENTVHEPNANVYLKRFGIDLE